MDNRVGKLITFDELTEELNLIPKDYVILLLKNETRDCHTIYIAPNIDVMRERIKNTLDKGEFRSTVDEVVNALGMEETDAKV